MIGKEASIPPKVRTAWCKEPSIKRTVLFHS